LHGRLAGVSSAGRTNAGGRAIQGQGFAIGVDRVRQILPQLRAGRSIAWTGMDFDYKPASAFAAQGLPPGLLVTHVVPGTPAQRAGFGTGPILITAVDGKPLDNTLASYCQAVGGARSGRQGTFTVLRGTSPR